MAGMNLRGEVPRAKGTVRLLADSIPVEDAERASRRVRGAITQQQQQLDVLQRFFEENKALSDVVLELPDAVSHQIMVPFGKAAFFPGRLRHTNEFLVLLGDNYFAERSAKQTMDILGRRSEFLDEKISSTKAQIRDLEAEFSFVTDTAEDAKAGLVEIREEYTGSGQLQLSQASTSKITAAGPACETNSTFGVGSGPNFGAETSVSGSGSADDHEFDLLMARFSELELAEAAASESKEDSGDEVSDDGNARVSDPFTSNLYRSEVSWNRNDLVEEEYDSEEMQEEDSHLDDEDDYAEDSQGSSEDERTSEDEDEDDDQTGKLADKHKQPLPGNLLSRFARKPYADVNKFIFQHRKPIENRPQTASNHEFYRIPQKSEAMVDSSCLQEDPQGLTRPGVHQKERQADEMKVSVGSSLSDYRGDPSLGEPAAPQLKAFTGIVTEHSFTDTARVSPQQVKNSQQSRQISKFKMTGAGRKDVGLSHIPKQ